MLTNTHVQTRNEGIRTGKQAEVCSDTGLLERVIDLVNGNRQHFPDGKGDYLIYWSVGTYLGELSGCVFPIEDDCKPVDKRPVLKYGTASNKE